MVVAGRHAFLERCNAHVHEQVFVVNFGLIIAFSISQRIHKRKEQTFHEVWATFAYGHRLNSSRGNDADESKRNTNTNHFALPDLFTENISGTKLVHLQVQS